MNMCSTPLAILLDFILGICHLPADDFGDNILQRCGRQCNPPRRACLALAEAHVRRAPPRRSFVFLAYLTAEEIRPAGRALSYATNPIYPARTRQLAGGSQHAMPSWGRRTVFWKEFCP